MMLNKLVIAGATAAIASAAYAQETTGVQVLTSLPPDAKTITIYYKRNVYDSAESKIGELSDVLIGKNGKVYAFIVSVGESLGISRHVAVPFNAVHVIDKNGKRYLTMNAPKDALKNAQAFRYDTAKATWEPAFE
jgi:sporulation protein YlmC with PRC-barrel domain